VAAGHLTLLCVVSCERRVEGAVELAGDVALELSADFVVGCALCSLFGDVGMGAGTYSPVGEHDVV
jgi:hypothetical protein